MLTIYLIIGISAGILSGLFGLGGGVVIIPALSHVFLNNTLIPQSESMQMAIGTSLAVVVPTSASALYAHHRRHSVNWGLFRVMLPELIIGAILGAIIAHFLSSAYLKNIFALFLLVISLRTIFVKPKQSTEMQLSLRVVRFGALCIGILASLLGVGGGSLVVPFLLRCQLDIREATGTSVACGLSVGIVATLSFMLAGLFSMHPVAWSIGYIYCPAFLGIAVASTLLAPVGAALAHKLPGEWLKRVFGVFLLLMACDMLWFK